MTHIEVYTDGAARGNPDGPGGYGAVLKFTDKSGELHVKELSDGGRNMLECFDVLDKNGFEQVPTGSTWSSPDNMERLTAYCKSRLSGDRLLGFMQTPWYLTLDENEAILNEAADRMYASRKLYEGR